MHEEKVIGEVLERKEEFLKYERAFFQIKVLVHAFCQKSWDLLTFCLMQNWLRKSFCEVLESKEAF